MSDNPSPSDLAFRADFDAAVRAHDAAVAGAGVSIWAGSEPTFTDLASSAPEWLNAPTGLEKFPKALELLAAVASHLPGAAVLRTVGRQYEQEQTPRWNLGIYASRDGTPIWSGPPDPALAGAECIDVSLPELQGALLTHLIEAGFACTVVEAGDEGRRVAFASEEARLSGCDPKALLRPSVHEVRTPHEGLADAVAAEGLFLIRLSTEQTPIGLVPRVELPLIATTESFRRVLHALSQAGRTSGAGAMILCGYPPPVDASVAWATLTPDPGVIEINAAPYPTVAGFLAGARELYAAAERCGLSPYRLHFTGEVADSGGAGQITFGGPSSLQSPFFLRPQLLPALVRYVNRHPCLSYLFAHPYIGSSGQSVRADETSREYFEDLGLAIDLLERESEPPPERIWRSLAPFMADGHGNAHRAELNIEKLWNPYLPQRGKLGLTEFRAIRMQHTPEHAAAVVALYRAILARLCALLFDGPLIDWGRNLHDRFALPWYLTQDLAEVLEDLERHGFGLGRSIRRLLMDDQWRVLAEVPLGNGTLTIRQAIEFWPLVGDAASQESGASRLIDSSTGRIELRFRAGDSASAGCPWTVAVGGVELPLNAERDAEGPVWVKGIRYRRFVPGIGLHPTLAAQGPIHMRVCQKEKRSMEITLHPWRPDDSAYPGLPIDLADAAARRAERVVVKELDAVPSPARLASAGALTSCCIDLRRL